MAALDAGVTPTALRDRRLAACVPAFAATLFLSALLLFWVQPMFSKMVLPLLGGTSAVWSISMVVFQTLLLGGYVYAWIITSKLKLKTALILHVGLLLVSTICLPIAVAAGFERPPESGVTLWVIALFVASVGLPCFVVSATAPLLQAWFAQSGHKQSANPYVLYGASNLGSFAVLIAYPFLIEPTFGLAEQSKFWSVGFGVLVLGIAGCGVLAIGGKTPITIVHEAAPSASWSMRLRWIVLAFVPSGLLVAVTAHITTDVASAPFLWIAPLAIYLLTFILAFSARPVLPARLLAAMQPIALALAALLFLWGGLFNWMVPLAGNLIAFFIAAMVCHTELYQKRPQAAQLTEFYTWMSVGGVLGGIFAALIAPLIFTSVLEYPLLLLAAFAVRPDVYGARLPAWTKEGAITLGIAVAVALPYFFIPADNLELQLKYYAGATIGAAMIMGFLGKRPIRLFWFAAVVFVGTNLFPPGQHIVLRERSFYGVYKVLGAEEGRFHLLFHGTTMHGAEEMRDAKGRAVTGRPEPLAYYYTGGPYGQAIEAIRDGQGGSFGRVAAVGLGIGALSCYARPGESWTYYELDPMVVALAENKNLFRTFNECGGARTMVLGDARLTLNSAKPGLDLLILDAFSSDSIPAHLLTKEAFALYKAKLSAHGAIALNISNRNLELKHVVAAAAAVNGLRTYVKIDNSTPESRRAYSARAEIALVAQSDEAVRRLGLDAGWKPMRPSGERVWTDDYSNILGLLLARSRQP